MEDNSLIKINNTCINNDEINKNEREYSSKLFSYLENHKKTKEYYELQRNIKDLNQDIKLLEGEPKGKIKLYKKINRRSSIFRPFNLSPNRPNLIRRNSNISIEKLKMIKEKQLTEQNSPKSKISSSQIKKPKNLILIENSNKIRLPKLISYINKNNNTEIDNLNDEHIIINNVDLKSENSQKNELPLIQNNQYYKRINNSNISSGKYRQMTRDNYDNDDEEQIEKIINRRNYDLKSQNNKIMLFKKNLKYINNSPNNNKKKYEPTKISYNNQLLYSADKNKQINRNRSVRKLFQKCNLIDNTEQFILNMRKKSNKIENRIKRGMVSQNLLDWEMKSRIKLNQWRYGVAEVAKYFIDLQAYGKPEEDELVNRKTFFNHVEDIIKELQDSIKEKQIKIITEENTEKKTEKDKDKNKETENIRNRHGYNDVENVINKKKEFNRELSKIKIRQKNENKTRDYINSILFKSEAIANRIKNSAKSRIKKNNKTADNKKSEEENKKEKDSEDKNKSKEVTERTEENNNDKEDDQQSNNKNDENDE